MYRATYSQEVLPGGRLGRGRNQAQRLWQCLARRRDRQPQPA